MHSVSRTSIFLIGFIFGLCSPAFAAVYDVGPGKALERIGDAPWESLMPGDTVRIGWRPEAYHEKFVIARQGTQEEPITLTLRNNWLKAGWAARVGRRLRGNRGGCRWKRRR